MGDTSSDTEIATSRNHVNGLKNLLNRFGFSEIEIRRIMTDCGLGAGEQHTSISLEQVRSNKTLAKALERVVLQLADDRGEQLLPDGEEQSPIQQRRFSMEAVSYHNRVEDLWCVIEGKVYDLTGFAHLHPGGAGVLMSLSGGDATQAFQQQHGTSESVCAFLESLCI